MNLEGKAAIVTGGGGGVGRETALALAREGCSVLVNYHHSRDAAEQTAAEIESLGVRAIAHQTDVGKDSACREMVEQAVAAFGRLDVLVNSAGATRFIAHDQLDDVTDEAWDEIFAVNVKGPFHAIRAAKAPMLAGDGGSVVNISSVAGILASGSSIPYCASKAALNNLTIALARTLAPRIRVNAVAPGFIAGRWLEDGLGERYESTKQAFEAALPLRRVCRPEDVAACAMSLITGSDLVTGQTLVCDSGLTIAGFQASVSE